MLRLQTRSPDVRTMRWILLGAKAYGTWAGVVSALRTDVPRAFHNLSSMGEPAWPKYTVSALYSLSGGSLKEPQLIHRAWATARRLCGTQTASLSWAVTLSFPLCQTPCAGPYTAYVSRVPRGWVLWYTWLRRS